ncbi:conserved hypothetical protein [uncultured Candidatus Thioglobus sp.]|nr:conserved hypothetical protein [uncultured Candidatus Thioglobus sp.]SMM99919.1 conserved hypothetical protein [uncultured Candidatus Thioglobus sp.]
MPIISMFYGVIIRLYFKDNKMHNTPHIHAEYAEFEASIAIETGEVLSGKIPNKKLKLVQAWVEIHQEELQADWKIAVEGNDDIFKIQPLK